MAIAGPAGSDPPTQYDPDMPALETPKEDEESNDDVTRPGDLDVSGIRRVRDQVRLIPPMHISESSPSNPSSDGLTSNAPESASGTLPGMNNPLERPDPFADLLDIDQHLGSAQAKPTRAKLNINQSQSLPTLFTQHSSNYFAAPPISSGQPNTPQHSNFMGDPPLQLYPHRVTCQEPHILRLTVTM